MMRPPEDRGDTAPNAGDTGTPGPGAPGEPNALGSSQGQGPESRGVYGGYGVSERGQGGMNSQQPGARYEGAADYANAVPERMPRANAAGMARRAKRWLVGTSVVGFLVLAGLAAGNAVGVTAASGSSNGNSSDDGGHSVTNPKSNDDEENPFFGGQGSQSGSSNFGSATSQPPFSGSSAS